MIRRPRAPTLFPYTTLFRSRQRHSLLELCHKPELAAQVTLQPVERLGVDAAILFADILLQRDLRDRKSTRLNSSHTVISYAVFCLKKKRPMIAACLRRRAHP